MFYCHRPKIPKKNDLKAVWRQPSKPPTIRNMENCSHFVRLFQSPAQHVTDSLSPSPRWSPHSGSFTRLLSSSGRRWFSFSSSNSVTHTIWTERLLPPRRRQQGGEDGAAGGRWRLVWQGGAVLGEEEQQHGGELQVGQVGQVWQVGLWGGVAVRGAVWRDEPFLPPLLELWRLGHGSWEAIALVQPWQYDIGRPA